MAETKYAAFISYSHKDEVVARWLHRRLENYAIPRGAAPGYGRKGLFGRRIGRVFRDREELPAGYPLSDKINEALAQSDALIVLCSPNAARSEFVNKEILEFQRLGKGDRIFPVIVAGEDHEIFPPALSEKREILEADMRAGKDGRDYAALKVLAGLLRLEPNDLTQREARAQRRRLALAAVGMVVFALLAAAAGWFGYQSVRFNDSLQVANRNLSETNRKLNETLGALKVSSERLTLANQNLEQRSNELAQALIQVRAERDNSLRSQILAEQRRLSAEHALEQARIARDQSILANNRARINLHRFFFDNAQKSLSENKPFLALRYALAGYQLSPENRPYYELVLTKIYGSVGQHMVFDGYVAISRDERKIVSAAGDGTLRVWNVETGQQIGSPMEGQEGGDYAIHTVAFSPDGQRIVSASYDGPLRLWDAQTGRQISAPSARSPSAVAFSPDGRRIVSGSHDGTLRQWDVETGRQIGAPMTGHTADVSAVAFSPDGQVIVSGSGSGDRTLRLWNVETGRQIGAPLTGHRGDVNAVAFSRDGLRIVSGSDDGTLRLWEVETGRQIGAPLTGDRFTVKAVAFAPDGRRIVSSGSDGTLRIWDVEGGRQLGAPLTAPYATRQALAAVSFSPDGRRIVSAANGSIRVWDADTNERIIPPLPIQLGAISLEAISLDGRSAVDSTVRLWNTETRQMMWDARSEFGSSVAFSPDERIIVSGGADETLRLWDAATGRQIGAPLEGHEGYIMSVAFSPNGRRIVSGSLDKTLRLWDVETGLQIGAPLTGHTDGVTAVAFSPDRRRIVSGSGDRTLRLWNVETGRQIGAPLTGHTDEVRAVAFSRDGLRIVSSSAEGSLRLWDVETGLQIGAPLSGPAGSTVAFSPDGRRIVSGGSLWDVGTGLKISDRLGLPFDASVVAFSLDGQQIFGGATGTFRRLDVSSLVQPWEVMAREACLTMLGRSGRTFSAAEIDADPLLFSEWNDTTRDVCAGVPGVPPLPRPERAP
jgi:WD40 repeat protein